MRRWAGTTVAMVALIALGCGPVGGTPGMPNDDPGQVLPSGSGGTVETHEGALIRVELRGQDELQYADGSHVTLERFTVNFGGVRLLRDLSDPAAAPVELSPRRLPVLAPGGETTLDRFIIGIDKLQDGFRGIRLELSPPQPTATSLVDGTSNTVYLRGVYAWSSSLASKGDSAASGISPNPAPIKPYGSATQPISSVVRVPFAFVSNRVEDLLVGFSSDLAAGRTLVVVFRANRWFSDQVRAVFASEARRRAQLGIPSETVLTLSGDGAGENDPVMVSAGRMLEENILETIGIEVY